jgi:hypothetical protein
MDDLKKAKEAFEKMTPGDAATALIAGTVGFLIDAGLNPIGFLTATETGFICASGALGLKKALQAGWTKLAERKKPDEESARAKRVLEKLSSEESDKRCQALARRIKNDLEFFESGVITADDLKASVDEAIKAYRDHVEDP